MIDFEEAKNGMFEMDRIIEHIYPETDRDPITGLTGMEMGIINDIENWSKTVKKSELKDIYDIMDKILINYLLNRMDEFEDPTKAEIKIMIARRALLGKVGVLPKIKKKC